MLSGEEKDKIARQLLGIKSGGITDELKKLFLPVERVCTVCHKPLGKHNKNGVICSRPPCKTAYTRKQRGSFQGRCLNCGKTIKSSRTKKYNYCSERECQSVYMLKYMMNRYHSDPAFRRRIIDTTVICSRKRHGIEISHCRVCKKQIRANGIYCKAHKKVGVDIWRKNQKDEQLKTQMYERAKAKGVDPDIINRLFEDFKG